MCDLVTKAVIDFTVKMPAFVWEGDDHIVFTNDEYKFVDADFISEEGEDVIVKISAALYFDGNIIDNFKEVWSWHGNTTDTDILVGDYVVSIISDDNYKLSLEY